jgi:hypothetical protein
LFDIQCFLIIDFEMKHQISTIQTWFSKQNSIQ